ncbi:MAG: methyltransferase domain-containing protein [Promethearchaeota archaeon]
MKKIDSFEYYNVAEIAEKIFHRQTEDEIKALLEEGKINGMKIEDEWYANKEEIESYIEIFQNEKYFTIGPINIDLTEVKMEGRILDIGGGGEGIIGQFKGEYVIAIDPSKHELEESHKSRALKIIMDAKDLKFLDNTFNSVFAFFTMMYIPLNDHRKIFQEIYRVLKKNGEFFLWDLKIPNRNSNEKEIYIVTLRIKINENIIDTGYGTKWNKEQDVNYYIELAKNIGFQILEQNIDENIFYLKFKKV